MAGLLDFLSSPEAQMGIGLLAAGGPRTDPNQTGFGTRMADAMSYAEKQQDNALKRKMAVLAEQRAQAMFKMQQDAYAGIPGASMGATPSAGGGGASGADPASGLLSGGSGAPVAGLGGGDTNAQLVRLEKMAIANVPGAKEAFEIYKYRSDPQQLQPGTFSQNRVTGAREYIPDVKTGMGFGPQGMYALPGSGVIAQMEGDKQGAIERAKAGLDLVEVPDGQGGTQKMTRAQAVQLLGGQGGGQPVNRQIPSVGTGQPSAMDMARIQADIQRTGNPNPTINFSGSASPAPAQRWGASLTADQKDAQEVAQARSLETVRSGAKAGTDRIMGGYDNARSAVDSLTSTSEARKSLVGGSFVGTGAETKLMISKALQGLGFDVAPDKATNTDYLQATLGQGILNKAKTLGANPTDNDARIIRSIVGSIGTDPNALNKLLDHQDLMSNRAIDSHNKNYGDAKSRGFDAGFDLTVDRPKPAASAAKTASLADITETARRSGKSTAEVTKALKDNGYTIGGQ